MMLSAYDKALEDAQSAIKLDENFLKVSVDHIYCNQIFVFMITTTRLLLSLCWVLWHKFLHDKM